MEPQLPFSLGFLVFVAPLLFFFLLKPFVRIFNSSTIQKKLPPGPWKLPLLGNLLHMTGSLPHRALATLAKKHGPIIHLQLGQVSTIVISSSRLAKEALVTQDLALANRPLTLAGKIIFYDHTNIGNSPYGNYWRQMRKICTSELIGFAKVRSFHYVREEEVSNFIESIRLSSGSPINISKMIYLLQNVIVCRATFGNMSKEHNALIQLIKEVISYTGGFEIADVFPSFKLLHIFCGSRSKLKKTHQELDQILDNLIDEHKENLGASKVVEDLVDVLLRLKDSGEFEFPITYSNIKAVIMDMFAAGTDPTSTTIEWAMTEMMRNPRVMEKAQAELRQLLRGKKIIIEADIQDSSYLKLVIKETLRLRGSSPLLLPRQCREECEIGGYTVPVDTHFIINSWAISRDPENWHDAESFEPERFENTNFNFNGTSFEFIPFGAGRRMCPGMLFAIANVELTLAKLLYHFDWKLPDGMKPEDIDTTEIFGGTVRKKNNLHLVATPYSPL